MTFLTAFKFLNFFLFCFQRSVIFSVLNEMQTYTYLRKEGNVLFNDALNTFYLRVYGVRNMVKDNSDNERGNPLPPHRLLFRVTARVLLYAPSHKQDCTYHGLCYTSRGALAGTKNSSMGLVLEIQLTITNKNKLIYNAKNCTIFKLPLSQYLP